MRRSTYAFCCCGLLLCTAPVCADFVRGDANRDGRVNIQDPIELLAVLFGTETAFSCADAADADDDGTINVLDTLKILALLFQGDSLPAPAPHPGPDPTCDALACSDAGDTTPAIVLSEIMYNSARASSFEFVELHNRSSRDIDVSGYEFTNGITFVLPDDTSIPSGGFLVVAKDPGKFRGDPAAVGPYEGGLANGGERLTLVDGDCLVETVRYDDRTPWPLGADGYGPSLERIDFLAPAADFHSWRASFSQSGSGRRENSTAGIPPRPVILSSVVAPPNPSSSDTVEVRITLDVAPGKISSATLRATTVAIGDGFDLLIAAMSLVREEGSSSVFSATIPPQPSQSLVRYNVDVELTGGATVRLPHEGEPRPVFSYFVYDGEIEHSIPLLWLVPSRREGLYEKGLPFGGAVVVENGSNTPLVFDGTTLTASTNGQKLKFLKGEEYRGDRTVNLIPEVANIFSGGGLLGPHQEQLGFQVFRDSGAIAPRADWFRIIQYKNPLAGHTHSQRVMIQQVNERFLVDNGLPDAGDIYKLNKGVLEKHTNEDTPAQSLQDLRNGIAGRDSEIVRDFVRANFHEENHRTYSVLAVFMSNWDGYHNNLYFYHSLELDGRWMVFPWDLDLVFQPQHSELLVTYPKTGMGGTAVREAGFLSRPFHAVPEFDEAYRSALRVSIEPGGPLRAERLNETVGRLEAMLLKDLSQLEAYEGEPRPERLSQIVDSYASIRTFIEARIPFLQNALK